ncbi:MAG: site-specific integrase [Lachnospiraceae bacterium]|nr:site-specific integrase [Lachnospiraceae bacterium]
MYKRNLQILPEYIEDPSVNLIVSLINLMTSSKIMSGDPQLKDMTLKEIKKKFKENNITYTIYPTKDGRLKIRKPVQICRKEESDLLIELFRYYYGHDPDIDISVQGIYEEWIKYFKTTFVDTGHRSSLTCERYKSDWNKYYAGSDLASSDISNLKASKIKTFYAKISANETLTRRSLNNIKSILNQIYDYAVDHDYVSSNIARSVRTTDLICREEDNEDLVYSDDERYRIINQALKEDDVFARAIFLMFSLCVRIGELRSLKWSDIDWENRTVFIHAQIVRRKGDDGNYYFSYVNRTKGKKKEANRIQPLSDEAISLLKKQRKDNPFGEYIFMYNGDAVKTNTVNHHLKRICEKVGVKYLSSHKIRFWSVVNMSKEFNPAEVQYMAGHLDPATTDHYRKRVSRIGGVDTDKWNELYGLAK